MLKPMGFMCRILLTFCGEQRLTKSCASASLRNAQARFTAKGHKLAVYVAHALCGNIH